jgi:ATP-dependent helicase HrpB
VRKVLLRHDGSILAFLPGEGEIRRAQEILADSDLAPGIAVLPLHGSLDNEQQDRALAPPPQGTRKVVLATTIAETSLTIEGIGIVIDGGFKRVPRFDPASGMTRLDTVRVSAAAAEQRRGRAGRLGPGHCYRLWPEPETRALAPHDTPEILQADLAPLVLEAARWGSDPAALKLLDSPPPGAAAQAKDLLRSLEAITQQGRITPHGRRIAALPLHPRLAHMVIAGTERGWGETAAEIAALLSERDPVRRAKDAGLALRLEALHRPVAGADPALVRRINTAARQIRTLAGIRAREGPGDAGALLALAYPDRVAKARDRRGRFRLAAGGGAVIEETDPLSRETYLAVATTDGNPTEARIFLAQPIGEATLRDLFAARIERIETVHWDRRTQSVIARQQERLGELVLAERPLADPDPEGVAEAMIEGVRAMGLDPLPWSARARSLRERVLTMRRVAGEPWPDFSEPALLGSLEGWLRPHLSGITRRAELSRLDLARILHDLLSPAQRRQLDEALPAEIEVPSGSVIAIDYAGEEPVLRVKLQEMFGLQAAPKLAGGRLPLRIELLSPAGRALAITSDLEGFWRNSYPQVRAQMRGRYPKHPWPEDPLAAQPTRRAKRR